MEPTWYNSAILGLITAIGLSILGTIIIIVISGNTKERINNVKGFIKNILRR